MSQQSNVAMAIMAALGVRIPTDSGSGTNANPAGTTAMAVASTAGTFMAMLADATVLAARTSYPDEFRKNDPRAEEASVRRMRSRLVMSAEDPSRPHVAEVAFYGRPGHTRHFTVFAQDGKAVAGQFPYVELVGMTMLPGRSGRNEEAEVRAHQIRDGLGGFIPVVQVAGDGTVQPAGKHTCIFFHPEEKKGKGGKKHTDPMRAMPLGLVHKYLVDRWNEIGDRARAQGASQNFFRIEPIPNALHGSVSILFARPLGQPWIPMFKDERRLEKALEAGTLPEPDYSIAGIVFGKTLVPARRTQLPTIHQLDAATGCVECVWRVEESENSLTITYVGERGKVGDMQTRVQNVDAMEFDPFAILGLNPSTTSPGGMIVDRAQWLLRQPLDRNNPLYLGALEHGMVMPDDEETPTRNSMRLMAEMAKVRIERALEDLADQIIGRLTMYKDGRPELSEVLKETTPEALKAAVRMKSGTCQLAAWIGQQIAEDNAFNWSSWLQKKVRREVLIAMAKTEGINKPPTSTEQPAESSPTPAA